MVSLPKPDQKRWTSHVILGPAHNRGMECAWIKIVPLNHCVEAVGALEDTVFNRPDYCFQMSGLEKSTKASLKKPGHTSPTIFIIRIHPTRESRPNQIIHSLLYEKIEERASLSSSIGTSKISTNRARPQARHSPIRFWYGPPWVRSPVEVPEISIERL